KSLLNLAVVAITNFSDKPLQLGFYLSVFCLLLTGADGVILLKDLVSGTGIVTFDLVILMFLFLFTLMFFFLGILGLYLGDIQKECKKNPIYHVKDSCNL
ncbi:MAG TPA: hypothetical protein VM577_02160, partial [Anaerovoracaceae bacterium]|nr:hypothetical protein [Anaerovoracaceae bacterium]